MAPIYIYTEELFLRPRIKRWLKKISGRGFGGPLAVERSLIAGLKELGQPFYLNQPSHTGGVACVLNGVETLKWALEQKQKGIISKIIAGPNLVVTPLEAGGILQDKAIDIVVVPGRWVKDFYISLAPGLLGRVEVWPAGVDVPNLETNEKKYDALIYNKLKENTLAENIGSYLSSLGKNVIRLDYGKFSQQEYFNLISQSKILVYLSESESQGLAIFEAWARGVPSLVWERNLFTYQNYRLTTKAASEYVTEQVGLPFCDAEDFKKRYNEVSNKGLDPRGFVLANYSDARAAENYLKIAGI